MKNLLVQARVVTDPIKNPLIGWWYEMYFFYVKHRDLAARDTLVEMVLNPEATISSLTSAAQVETYHGGNTVDWAELCLNTVVDWYFRNEEETVDGFVLGNLPIASTGHSSWLDSVIPAADYAVPDFDVDDGSDNVLQASELERALNAWQMMKTMKLTDQTYEDFLATYGIRPAQAEIHKPELIRYVREWTYPSNTVNPTDGAPSSACSWSIAERADKDRFFKEPGFVFGVAVARPKVYYSRMKSAGAGMMNNALSWLPAVMNGDPWSAFKQVADVTGPLGDNTDANGYWVDIRDLLLYGDQFVNFAMGATDAGQVALPTVGLQKRYASSADADALFKAASPANQIRADGVCSLGILGNQRDASPTV